MELLILLRVLWRRRVVVGIGALVAMGAGLLLLKGSPVAAPPSVVTSVRLLLDTPDSQLVHVEPKAAETLAMRAVLFADRLATDPMRSAIARAAGLTPDEIDVFGPSSRIVPPVTSPLVEKTNAVRELPRTPYVLRAYADEYSPVVSLEASAPDLRRSQALLDAARATLTSLVAPQDPRAWHGFVVERLASPAPVAIVPGSGRRLFAVLGSAATFIAWCFAVLLAAGVSRRRVSAAQPA